MKLELNNDESAKIIEKANIVVKELKQDVDIWINNNEQALDTLHIKQ